MKNPTEQYKYRWKKSICFRLVELSLLFHYRARISLFCYLLQCSKGITSTAAFEVTFKKKKKQKQNLNSFPTETERYINLSSNDRFSNFHFFCLDFFFRQTPFPLLVVSFYFHHIPIIKETEEWLFNVILSCDKWKIFQLSFWYGKYIFFNE